MNWPQTKVLIKLSNWGAGIDISKTLEQQSVQYIVSLAGEANYLECPGEPKFSILDSICAKKLIKKTNLYATTQKDTML